MREKINEGVSVIMYYSARQRTAAPHVISWQNKEYSVDKIGYHHTLRNGQTLHHIYELTVKDISLWMRLDLDTSNLHWTLQVVADEHAN